jgi:hypothetical protein
MISELFLPEKWREKCNFWQKYSILCQTLIITLVFQEKRNFFAENWQKSTTTVITTLTPDGLNTCEGDRWWFRARVWT